MNQEVRVYPYEHDCPKCGAKAPESCHIFAAGVYCAERIQKAKENTKSI